MDQQSEDQQSGIPRDRRKSPKVNRPRKRRGRYTGSSGFQTDVAVLRAQGLSQRTAGRMLGVDQSTIARVEKLPEVQAKIADLREQWKIVAHNRINEVADSAWDIVQQAAEAKDAKAFEASTRGLVALEKISSSVAEVPQRVDVSGIPESQNSKAELRALLVQLFGTPTSEGTERETAGS